jgi:hypothetical protein
MSDGFVYFITDNYAIKIGWSLTPAARMANLQTSHHRDLRMIGSITGVKRHEKMLHERFKHLHIRGEWYRNDGELHDFLEGMKDEGRFVDFNEHEMDRKMDRLRKRFRNDQKMLEAMGLNDER